MDLLELLTDREMSVLDLNKLLVYDDNGVPSMQSMASALDYGGSTTQAVIATAEEFLYGQKILPLLSGPMGWLFNSSSRGEGWYPSPALAIHEWLNKNGSDAAWKAVVESHGQKAYFCALELVNYLVGIIWARDARVSNGDVYWRLSAFGGELIRNSILPAQEPFTAAVSYLGEFAEAAKRAGIVFTDWQEEFYFRSHMAMMDGVDSSTALAEGADANYPRFSAASARAQLSAGVIEVPATDLNEKKRLDVPPEARAMVRKGTSDTTRKATPVAKSAAAKPASSAPAKQAPVKKPAAQPAQKFVQQQAPKKPAASEKQAVSKQKPVAQSQAPVSKPKQKVQAKTVESKDVRAMTEPPRRRDDGMFSERVEAHREATRAIDPLFPAEDADIFARVMSSIENFSAED